MNGDEMEWSAAEWKGDEVSEPLTLIKSLLPGAPAKSGLFDLQISIHFVFEI
jgi:hypothetical protein